MSIKKTHLLPNIKHITYEERTEAEAIIQENLGKEYDNFDGFEFYLLSLFLNTRGEDTDTGSDPWRYRDLLKGVIKLMLLPENAAILPKIFDKNAGALLVALFDFFSELAEPDLTERISTWTRYKNAKESLRGHPLKDMYSLWKEYINSEQPTDY